MNDIFESNIRQINLASPMVGICVPFRYRLGDLNVVSVVDKNGHTSFFWVKT